jgi:hypothetical protein
MKTPGHVNAARRFFFPGSQGGRMRIDLAVLEEHFPDQVDDA